MISSAYVIEQSGCAMASRKSNFREKLRVNCPEFLFSDSDDDIIDKVGDNYDKRVKIDSLLDDGCDNILNETYEDVFKTTESPKPNVVPKTKNSKSKIERNKLRAIIRRINRGPSGQRKYDYVSEYFWHVEEWPTYAIKALLSKSFNYTERLQLASFLLGNGLRETETAIQFVKLYNTNWSATSLWQKRLLEFEKLFAYMDKPINDPDRANIRARYFYYNMQAEVTMFLNGMRRNRNGEAVELNL